MRKNKQTHHYSYRWWFAVHYVVYAIKAYTSETYCMKKIISVKSYWNRIHTQKVLICPHPLINMLSMRKKAFWDMTDSNEKVTYDSYNICMQNRVMTKICIKTKSKKNKSKKAPWCFLIKLHKFQHIWNATKWWKSRITMYERNR